MAVVEFDPILADELAVLHHLPYLALVYPGYDEFHYLFNGEFQLDLLLFLKPFPFLPVLQPLSEDVHFVRIHVAVI